MARARDPNRDVAKQMYLDSNGEMLLKDIAAQLGKSSSQIRNWKTKDKWDEQLNDCATNETNDCATIGKQSAKVVPSNARSKKASGNPNPKNQFTKRNEVSVKHGFYRQWLPQDMVEIIEETKDFTLADRLWFQIETKFASLIQLHKIMFVESRNDTLKEVQSWSNGESSSESYKIVYAFEQYAEYIKTEARLTAEWRNVVKQFLELSDEYDERRMKLEQMTLNIEKTKTDIERNNIAIAKETGAADEYEDDGFLDALKGVKVDWSDD